ncbi:MAG TPA: PHP domain-containing protein [Candidatus Bathyarchaeia archaeon]|nr:PHP domain-containing protein [Candidatus Bathyarchaeia archaeon]
MTRTADLHIHTCLSDGADTPQVVVELAIQKELSAIAITDHDMVDGIEPAVEAARGTSLEVIAGVELSTEWHGSDIHILGYCFDLHHPVLKERLAMFCNTRLSRIHQIVKRLNEMGKMIRVEDVLALTGSDAVGRPHVAQVLLAKGYVNTLNEAFDKYIGEGRPGYVPKFKQSPFEAINLIREAGGVAVMAHPMETRRDELIASFVEAGLGGLEVCYPNTSSTVIGFYEGLADKYGLIKTGGSDAHGRYRSYSPIGIMRVDYSVVEQLKKASGKECDTRHMTQDT